MPRYNSGSRKLPEGEKRKFFRVSMQGKRLKELDAVVEKMNAMAPYADVTRTSIIEALILEFLAIHEEKAAK